MKSFNIKSSLAEGLCERLRQIESGSVVKAVKEDPIKAIRQLQKIIDKITNANHVFADEVHRVEGMNREAQLSLSKKLWEDAKGKDDVEKAKMVEETNRKITEKVKENQDTSKAEPDVIVTVKLSDDEYSKVLMPVFNETYNMWALNNELNDGGKSLFLTVADALEAVA